MKTFAERLNAAMNMASLSQAQLAEQVNISQSYMAKIECGFLSNCVSLAVLNNISSELNVSIDELISPN